MGVLDKLRAAASPPEEVDDAEPMDGPGDHQKAKEGLESGRKLSPAGKLNAQEGDLPAVLAPAIPSRLRVKLSRYRDALEQLEDSEFISFWVSIWRGEAQGEELDRHGEVRIVGPTIKEREAAGRYLFERKHGKTPDILAIKREGDSEAGVINAALLSPHELRTLIDVTARTLDLPVSAARAEIVDVGPAGPPAAALPSPGGEVVDAEIETPERGPGAEPGGDAPRTPQDGDGTPEP